MRALAAASVLSYHVWLYSSPLDERVELGWRTALLPDLAFGVTLFFTLSGFLLYRPFAAALIRDSMRPSFAAYLRNRALRIAPAYVVICLLSSLVLRSVFVRDAAGDLDTGAAPGATWLARNLSLTQNYTPSGLITGIPPAWSLAAEVVFYVTLPLLVLLAVAASRKARRATAALVPPLVLLAVGLAGKAASDLVGSGPEQGWGGDWNSVLERSFLCHADLFAFGMALAVVHVRAEDGALRVGGRARLMLALGAIAGYAATTAWMDRWGPLGHSPFNTLMALACTLFLGLVVLPAPSPRPSAIVRLLETRPFVVTGLVSYSIFLWHVPVIWVLREHGLTWNGNAGLVANLVVVGAVTFALSVLTYTFVEEPALRRKRPGLERRSTDEHVVTADPAVS